MSLEERGDRTVIEKTCRTEGSFLEDERYKKMPIERGRENKGKESQEV